MELFHPHNKLCEIRPSYKQLNDPAKMLRWYTQFIFTLVGYYKIDPNEVAVRYIVSC